MFSRNNDSNQEKKKNSTLSIIGIGMDFTGEINTEGDVHIDGIVKGNIKADEVVIGMDGNFNGEIQCNILKINGKISGKFMVSSLQVCSDGLLEGKAKYEEITVERGGRVQGELGINKNLVKASLNKDKDNNDS